MFPMSVQFTDTEAKSSGRGTMKRATCNEEGLVAMGWVDGNPVHFLTTADGTEELSTKRRVGGEKQSVKAPVAIKKYNHGMQAVDRFDQLMSLFSLAKRHAFKKYYNKLAMALLDIPLVNAEQHYYMGGAKKDDEARFNFRNKLADGFIHTVWNNYESSLHLEEIFAGTEDQTTPSSIDLTNDGFKLAPTIDLCNSDEDDVDVSAGVLCQPVSVMAFHKRNNDNKKGLRNPMSGLCI